MTDKYKTTKKEFTLEDKDGNKKWKIIVKNEDLDITKDKYKDNEEVKISASVQQLDKEGREVAGQGAINKTIKGKVKTGIFYDSIEISKEKSANGEFDLKENFQTPVDGWRAMFHVTYSVGAALLLGLIVWWWLASRKEDKEEESL